MNSHLNVFKTYTKKERTHQLENDLTRALAICMQEDSLFFHEIIKSIFNESNYFTEFFDDLNNENEISIEIQKSVSNIKGFEHIYAVSLSEHTMETNHFWNQSNHKNYDPICDIVLKINNIIIIIEAKRDSVDCTTQLYNQAYNIIKDNSDENNINELMKEFITPFDLNWYKLMNIAVKVISFQKSIGLPNRFLNDFIDLVKKHDFRWISESAILSLSKSNRPAIIRRIESALNELDKQDKYDKLPFNNRLGLRLGKPWAQEVIYNINNNGDLIVAVYPGNTKSQGLSIFHKEPQFKEQFILKGKEYNVSKNYHIKFNGQSYITAITFNDNDLNNESNLYSKDNFNKYAGRKKRDSWEDIENLLDNNFKSEVFNWRNSCGWNEKIINSNRTQFDLSFGFELSIRIPFEDLKRIDTDKDNLFDLINLIESIYNEFENIVL